MKVAVIIPAAGIGKRMGNTKKPYMHLAGKPILAHTLAVFQQCPLVNEIFVAIAEGDEQRCAQDVILSYGIDKVVQVLLGGDTRQASVFNALKKLSDKTEMVIVHDAVRPFLTEDMIRNTLESAKKWGAATVAVPVKDTIKVADDSNIVVKTLDRQRLWSIQTPQTFRYELLIKAHLYALENKIHVTDDASLIEQMGGYTVKLVIGSYENIKITTPGDLVIAKAIMESRGMI